MKINQNVTFLKTAAPAPAVAASKTSAADSAFATRASVVASPARLPSTTGDFDAARVAEIRDSIRAGSYKIDTARIADGLLSTVRDLIGKNPS